MEGRKDDQGKIRMELIPPELMIAVGDILTSGAKKYTVEAINEWDALLYARCATELQVVTPKGNAVSVTRNTCENPIPIMQNANVKIDEIGKPETQIKCASWQSVEHLIRQHVLETNEQNGSVTSKSAASQSSVITSYALKGVRSAEQPNTCTLTIVTPQGSLEVFFAPDAIMGLDFWTTVWKGLKEHFGISKPLNATGDRNWEHGMDWSRVYGAMLRHQNAWWSGEDTDPESGRSHLWHVACCAAFLLTYEMRGVGRDDRWKSPTADDSSVGATASSPSEPSA